jgi:hypothetical protein
MALRSGSGYAPTKFRSCLTYAHCIGSGSLARVFSSAEMDRLFIPKGMELSATSYVPPQFERAAAQANSWESRLTFLAHSLIDAIKFQVCEL